MTFQEIEKTFNICFTLKDGSFRPVNEWLDDLYLKFTVEQALVIVRLILSNGEQLFADIRRHQQ